jgi:RNA-directed DNA polymerase
MSPRGNPGGAQLSVQHSARPSIRLADHGSRRTSLVGIPRRVFMASPEQIASNLAQAFLAGDWTLDELVQRGALACGQRGRWLRPLARRVLAAFASQPAAPTAEALSQFLQSDTGFQQARLRHHLGIRQFFWSAPTMRPASGPPAFWQVPALVTPAQLAEWLGLDLGDLHWFADCQGREAKVPPGPLRHYSYHWLAKPSGRSRLLEAPKSRLKALQRRLLRDILEQMPAHDAVHGCRRGRSIHTYVEPHVGQRIVIRLDLKQFFPSVGAGRVRRLFETAGYPRAVVRLLTGLCTNVVPGDVLDQPAWKGDRRVARALLTNPHLPQGAPTSPALANLCVHRLDCRLAALAEKLGARYTRYADDLAFSGGRELERAARRFQVQVGCIVLDEGFCLNMRKTRFMRRAIRQQLVGIVVNDRPNVIRCEYDTLRAVLHNCVCQGPESQNRAGHRRFRDHLLGRITYLEQFHRQRGLRLRALFEQIRWPE